MTALELKDYLPIVISLLAVIVSLLTLYLTHFRSANLTIVAGEYVNVHHFLPVRNLAISIPITITNSGARVATVRRFALLVQTSGATEGYMLEPLVYEKADDNTNMKTESLAVPITVVGRGAETRQVLFRASLENPNEFQQLRAGEYQVTVLAWLRNSDEPQAADTFRLVVETKDTEELAKNLEEQNGRLIRLRQATWRKWSAHRLTELEVRALKAHRQS